MAKRSIDIECKSSNNREKKVTAEVKPSGKVSSAGGKVIIRRVKSLMDGVDTPKFRKEAKEIDTVLKRSFGKIISEASARYKASYALVRAASHWAEGDSRRLVVALAHRYQKPHLISKKPSAPQKKLVSSPRNSKCSSARLKDLDWQRGWWTDDSFGMHYIHVHHKDGETIHRVYCKSSDRPRIQMDKGRLYWLYQED